MKVDVEEVMRINRRLAEINSVEFEDIEWCFEGKNISIGDTEKEWFRFVGLSNAAFWHVYSPENFKECNK